MTQFLLRLIARYATFLRYCVIGAIASAIFYLVANACIVLFSYVLYDSPYAHALQTTLYSHFPHTPSSHVITLSATLCGSIASFVFGYFTQMRLAFRAYPSHSTMLPRYIALLALIAIYAQVIAYLGAYLTHSYYLISAFIALSVPIFSYPLQKFWVFTSNGGGGATHSVDFAYFLAYDTSALDSISALGFALSFIYFLFLFYSLFHARESSLESNFPALSISTPRSSSHIISRIFTLSISLSLPYPQSHHIARAYRKSRISPISILILRSVYDCLYPSHSVFRPA